MIAKLKGSVEAYGDNWIIIDVSGVGYHLYCSAKTLNQLPGMGEAYQLWTDLLVRQDSMTLYGFSTLEERDFFRLLMSVQGVGAKVALALLSIGVPSEIAHAIQKQDKAFIGQADGVGPKLAARIVNELKDKVGMLTLQTNIVPFKDKEPPNSEHQIKQDVVSILVNLGYRSQEAEQAVNFTLQKNPNHGTLEEVLKMTLSALSRV